MKIGNLEVQGDVFLAPMAGITDAPFRRIVEDFGVSALWTEMISAHGLVVSPERFHKILLGGRRVPTIFQISGHDPKVMADAAQGLEDLGAAAIDINMGCPARKIVHKGAGAALMKNLPLAEKIVSTVRKAVRIPVTTKIRSGWSDQSKNAPVLARILEDSGADAVIIHSRSYCSKHSGPVSLKVIEEVKQAVHIPVIGNGGIQSVCDAETMIALTNCDGVMVGRGALGKPWLPSLIMKRLSSSFTNMRPLATFLDVIRDHFRLTLELWPVLDAVRRMRKHLGWYSRGFTNGTEFRQRVFREEDLARVLDQVEKFFGSAIIL
jgi:tRNA-dihydrouridine synthase B